MTDTSGEMNLQSKQDIICHVAKVKPATSAHYVADVVPFLAPVCCAGGRWFEPQTRPTLRVLK